MSLHGYSDHEYEADDDQPTLISKLDLSSPLHLHPNDSITLTVVSVKLKGTENYQVWSCAMLLALEGKNKTGFIDGSCRISNTDEVLETYDKVDGSVTFSLHHKINSLSQNGSSIADYYHRLNAMWKQFDALVQLPRCTCHAAEDFKKHNQLMKLMQFLMGLDDCYMQIKSNILSRDELSYVRCVYAIISSEKSHRVVSSFGVELLRDLSLLCLVLMWKTRVMFRGLKPLLATLGLLMCFKLIGYPPDFGKRNNSSNTNQNNQNFNKRLISNNNSTGSSSTFSDEQISKLLSLIKENSLGDKGIGVQANMTGVNQHLTYTDEKLVNTIDISYLGTKVSHPNGTKALITNVGNLNLTNFLTLYDVLVVPEYSVTLVSVHKARQTREPFPLSKHKSTVLGELVNFDLWGPYRVVSKEGHRYFLTIVDDFTRAVWVYLLKSKEDVLDCIWHSQGSNGSASESERAAIFDHNTTLSEDDIVVDDTTEKVHVLNNQPLRRFERASIFPNKYNEYVVDSKVKYGLEKYVGYSNLTSEIFCFTTELNKAFEPKNYWEACKDQHWIEAMNKEMDALYRNDT
ncbi:ribonuclease H-like domain-containing protein [Tanacetum coccineum]